MSSLVVVADKFKDRTEKREEKENEIEAKENEKGETTEIGYGLKH